VIPTIAFLGLAAVALAALTWRSRRLSLAGLLVMLPWWRNRQCDRKVRTCWECAAYERWLAKARGEDGSEAMAQAEFLSNILERAADAKSALAAAALRPDEGEWT
jgi:hypothetical protein